MLEPLMHICRTHLTIVANVRVHTQFGLQVLPQAHNKNLQTTHQAAPSAVAVKPTMLQTALAHCNSEWVMDRPKSLHKFK